MKTTIAEMKSAVGPLESEALKIFLTYKTEHIKTAIVSIQELHNHIVSFK